MKEKRIPTKEQAHDNRRLDLAKIALFTTSSNVELDEVGSFLGEGDAHRVYEYGQTEVVKIPKNSKPAARMTYEARIMQATYGSYIKPISVITRPDGEDYLLLSRKLPYYRYLTPILLDNEGLTNYEGKNLRTQFQEIITADRALFERLSMMLDYFGGEGIRQTQSGNPEMRNLVVEFDAKGANFAIMDTELAYVGADWHENSIVGQYGRLASYTHYAHTKTFIDRHFLAEVGDNQTNIINRIGETVFSMF